jgi:hypothetical protein
MGSEAEIVYTGEVLDLRAKVWVCVVPLLMGLPVRASVPSAVSVCRFGLTAPEEVVVTEPVDSDAAMRESLRRDAASHPADFVVFLTRTGADHFVKEHRDDVERETNSRVVSRGIVGYWQGKTLVVLPWAPLKNFQ